MMSDEDMQADEAATGADASRLFLEQMTMHHEGAITMAQDDVDNGQIQDAVELRRPSPTHRPQRSPPCKSCSHSSNPPSPGDCPREPVTS